VRNRHSFKSNVYINVNLVHGERKRSRESFLDRAGLEAINAMAKCRDGHVLQPVA
jgi:hypothetical protein